MLDVMDQQRFVGEILVRHGALEQARMEELLQTAVEKQADLVDLVLATRETEEEKVVRALASEVGIEYLEEEIKPDEVAAELIDAVPISFARTHKVIPLRDEGDFVRVAISNPLDPGPIDDLRALLGKRVEPVAAPREKIEDAINSVYERKADGEIGQDAHEEVDEIQDLLDAKDEAPVIRWVNNLFYNASRSNASDIHVEPGDKEVTVRNRIDGKLFLVKTAPKSVHSSIVARIKIEAGLNIAEKRLPQDGRITKKIQGSLIDVRVSVVPTARGERIVMRLLDKDKVALDLTDLGFEGAKLKTMHHLISRPNGIILVTGPTGSGKTTTLSASLRHINSPDLNILTAEDPVEYDIPGVGQVQVHPKIGLTFASALRSFLRQDPDVIMVGEIRDQETAEIAIHASLTGHLVLSTLHTNDAAGAVTRLVEMEIQPFLIASSVLAVVAQRLVRRLCKQCRQPYRPTEGDLRSLGIDEDRLALLQGPGVQVFRGVEHDEDGPEHAAAPLSFVEGDELAELLEPEPTRVGAPPSEPPEERSSMLGFPESLEHAVFYRGMGCDECSQTGYRGRIAITEMLVVDEPVRAEILNNSDAATIARSATSRGMRTLREDGQRLVLAGMTSLEEVLAATQASEVG